MKGTIQWRELASIQKPLSYNIRMAKETQPEEYVRLITAEKLSMYILHRKGNRGISQILRNGIALRSSNTDWNYKMNINECEILYRVPAHSKHSKYTTHLCYFRQNVIFIISNKITYDLLSKGEWDSLSALVALFLSHQIKNILFKIAYP